MLGYDVKPFLRGKIHGFTLHNLLFVSARSFDRLQQHTLHQAFAGIQFDFAKCFDSIPYSMIWDVFSYYGCDPSFIRLLQQLYIF